MRQPKAVSAFCHKDTFKFSLNLFQLLTVCIFTPFSNALIRFFPQWIFNCSRVRSSIRLVSPLVSKMKYNLGDSGAFHGIFVPILAAEFTYPFDFTGDGYTAMPKLFDSYLANFLAAGDPNGGDLTEWETWTQDHACSIIAHFSTNLSPLFVRSRMCFAHAASCYPWTWNMVSNISSSVIPPK